MRNLVNVRVNDRVSKILDFLPGEGAIREAEAVHLSKSQEPSSLLHSMSHVNSLHSIAISKSISDFPHKHKSFPQYDAFRPLLQLIAKSRNSTSARMGML